MPTIQLTQGKEAIVSEEDFEYLNQWKWHYNKKGYARRAASLGGSNQRTLLMHRDIMKRASGREIPIGHEVDHTNGNKLDNRRENLRIVTDSQNSMNKKGRSGTSSQYKGIAWIKQTSKWRASVYVRGNHIYLGFFNNEEEAARAYDKAAKEHFGEYAYLNFPNEQ